MYNPIQIPYILNKGFREHILYKEDAPLRLEAFAVCFWEMRPRLGFRAAVQNVIITDGCIDLVVGYDDRQIGFSGMSRTNFHYPLDVPGRFFGVRFKPGAFHCLTGLPATAAMDHFLPIHEADPSFDRERLFTLPFEEAKTHLRGYLDALAHGETPDAFTTLFDRLSDDLPQTVGEIYRMLYVSPRQCQRAFRKHFGLTPQMVLCILRFQRCLRVLTSGEASPGDILEISAYYNQSHVIRDFKRNIGLTPLELIQSYAD